MLAHNRQQDPSFRLRLYARHGSPGPVSRLLRAVCEASAGDLDVRVQVRLARGRLGPRQNVLLAAELLEVAGPLLGSWETRWAFALNPVAMIRFSPTSTAPTRDPVQLARVATVRAMLM